MKGGEEIEVKSEKKTAMDDVGRGGKRRVTRMEMQNKRRQRMWRRETNPFFGENKGSNP